VALPNRDFLHMGNECPRVSDDLSNFAVKLQLGSYCEKTAGAFFDAIMETALHCAGLLEKPKLVSNF